VTLAEVASYGLIMFPAAQGPTLHAKTIDAFTKAGLEVLHVQAVTRALTMLALVSVGLGAALQNSTWRLAFHGVRYAAIIDTALSSWPPAMIGATPSPTPAHCWHNFRESLNPVIVRSQCF
jgi:hypothetical protein